MQVYTHLSGILGIPPHRASTWETGCGLTLKPTRLSRSSDRQAGDGSRPGRRRTPRGSPILLVVALAIKSTSRGPVLFRQDRVTEGARTFRMYKFRTMTDERIVTRAGSDRQVGCLLQAEERSPSDQRRQAAPKVEHR